MNTDWNADRVLDQLASIYDDLAQGNAVLVCGEAAAVVDTLNATFPEPERRALMHYSHAKAVSGQPAALDERTAKTLAGVVAMELNRQTRQPAQA